MHSVLLTVQCTRNKRERNTSVWNYSTYSTVLLQYLSTLQKLINNAIVKKKTKQLQNYKPGLNKD